MDTQPNAAPAPAPTPNAAPAPAPAPVNLSGTDRDGRAFDPTKFEPRKDKNGRWVRKPGALKPGRPRKHPLPSPSAGVKVPAPTQAPDFSDVEKLAAGAAPAGTSPAANGAPSADVGPVDEYTQAAVATVSAVATVGILALGSHAAPRQDEITAMVRAYADCYRHYGYAPETPPWLGPVIATGMWVGPHLQDQRSQAKLQSWKQRIAGWWMALRGRRDARAGVNVAAQANAAGVAAGSP